MYMYVHRSCTDCEINQSVPVSVQKNRSTSLVVVEECKGTIVHVVCDKGMGLIASRVIKGTKQRFNCPCE